ncbi:epidermal growth factor receptor substrate 15-like 1 isoform X2 [Hoplias malabaricus]|uniref:epidermal growth factor receptor substrate 15-like 1 isoform X2 n=1 Tax=Hoplias malabaricus TaxID=27720 RepID=UPI003461A31D
MAALMSLSQISNGNPAYETFYRQVDPGNTGKVGAVEAAQFLKKSGLSDSTLGKIWDLADRERKGYLDKRGFFMALRLVASAQSGNDISQTSLNQTMSIPTPKFRDTASPSLISAASSDSAWIVKFDDKAKYDGIFESLLPVNGLLSGDKVKPVLINSNLPLDVLGKIWNLSDIDRDGHLDKEEFAVVMHLVYRAREKEPVPSTLPTSLIPPSKKKKIGSALPGSVPVLPSSPFLMKDALRSTLPLSKSPLTTSNLSPSNSFRSSSPSPSPSPAPVQPVSGNWVVPLDDREQYEVIFELADSDFDGMVGGDEVKDIFMNSKLPQSVLAHIWSLADTKSTGKLTKEQFCLAMHLIQEKVKGVEPPRSLTPEMIPPSERGSVPSSVPTLSLSPVPAFAPSHLQTTPSDFSSSVGFELSGLSIPTLSRESSSTVVAPVELTGNKELDNINQEISQLQSEKRSIEQEIRQKEEALRQKNNQVHNMQSELEHENSSLQDMDQQKQVAQDRLQDMEQQKKKLEGVVNEAKSKYTEESSKISSMQTQIFSQEADLQKQEKELSRTKTDLYCLEQEEKLLEEKLREGKAKLESILKLLKTSQNEMDETRESELSEIQESHKELNKTIDRFNKVLSGSMSNLAEIDQLLSEETLTPSTGNTHTEDSFRSKLAMFNTSTTQDLSADPFHTEDPFKSDPFSKADPFGGDPFKQNDTFKDPFSNSDPFAKDQKTSPFTRQGSLASSSSNFRVSDPFATTDPFGSDSFGGKSGFADFGNMSKGSGGHAIGRKPTYPLPLPKKPVPARPAPPPYVGETPKTMKLLGER